MIKKKILIIDDEETIRDSFSRLLSHEGFEVLAAENGKAGLELATRLHPNLVICDVNMPQMDGYQLLAEFRKAKPTASIPFIFLTGRADRADLRLGMELGADDYLVKPCSRAELLGAIRARLAKQEMFEQQLQAGLEETEQMLNYATHYDTVTGLPNRMSLREKFLEIRRTGQDMAILWVSIDRFRKIQDSLGEELSDPLICHVAQRLVDAAGRSSVVARMSEDEFVLLIPGCATPTCSETAARKVIDSLSSPVTVESRDCFLSASIGASFYPAHFTELDALIRSAVQAMHQARSQGGNQFAIYSTPAVVGDPDAEEIALETGLRYAFQRSEFILHYQPQVSLTTGAIIGSEALIRWKHPKRGLVLPGKFIALAEETGLIISIGEWALKTALFQAKNWKGDNGNGNVALSVNVSARQFQQPDFPDRVIRAIDQAGLATDRVELELLESMIMQDADSAAAKLSHLKDRGIRIAIDDFGTGYSSLSYLKRFAIDILKIDQSFIRNISRESTSIAITRAMIQMAHSLRLTVIAEGVETQEELDFLRTQQCDAIQGFLFSKPLPPAEFEELLKTKRRLI